MQNNTFYLLAAESDSDLSNWEQTLNQVIQTNDITPHSMSTEVELIIFILLFFICYTEKCILNIIMFSMLFYVVVKLFLLSISDLLYISTLTLSWPNRPNPPAKASRSYRPNPPVQDSRSDRPKPPAKHC